MEDFVSISDAAKSVLADLKDKMMLNFEVRKPAKNDNQQQKEVI